MSSNLYTASKSYCIEWNENSRYLTRKSGKQHQLGSLTNSNNKLSQVYANELNSKLSSLASKIPALNTPKSTHNNQIKNSLHFLKKKVTGRLALILTYLVDDIEIK